MNVTNRKLQYLVFIFQDNIRGYKFGFSKDLMIISFNGNHMIITENGTFASDSVSPSHLFTLLMIVCSVYECRGRALVLMRFVYSLSPAQGTTQAGFA